MNGMRTTILRALTEDGFETVRSISEPSIAVRTYLYLTKDERQRVIDEIMRHLLIEVIQ
jgi:hypothetical protein